MKKFLFAVLGVLACGCNEPEHEHLYPFDVRSPMHLHEEDDLVANESIVTSTTLHGHAKNEEVMVGMLSFSITTPISLDGAATGIANEWRKLEPSRTLAHSIWPVTIDGQEGREIVADLHPATPPYRATAHALVVAEGRDMLVISIIGDAGDVADDWHAMKESVRDERTHATVEVSGR